MRYTRIATPQFTCFYATESEDKALEQFANTVGYDSYAELATTINKTVDEAKADLNIEVIDARDVIEDLIKEALVSDAVEDGAETPFRSVADWAEWCLAGRDGDEIRAFAKLHHLPCDDLIAAAREALLECDLDAINEPFTDTTFSQYDLGEAFSEVEDGLSGVNDDYREDWKVETAAEDAHSYVDAYICQNENSEWTNKAHSGMPFRVALDALAKEYILSAIQERDAA